MFHKKTKPVVYATQTGTVYPIEESPDPVFAEKVLGDGVFIRPTDGHVYAPIAGKIRLVADTKHAYGILGADGLEILIHIGIDSVDLNGKGFTSHVKPGQKVKAGTLLCEADLELFQKSGISADTMILISNKDQFKVMEKGSKPVAAKETEIFRYEKG
ncbi:MAG: PTS glucose transporter subunit IIA [Lachnospiraceae bacterium]|jgi:glucose-specific phosphotransferase system IIA component|nr:PTS glucose transporter subunit IIA [Lachnospiraceae bacterium]